MPDHKIVYFTASDPGEVNECYHHLALILYPDGAPWPVRVTGRTKDVVQTAAEDILADELERIRKKLAKESAPVTRRRREEPLPVHAGAVPDPVDRAREIMAAHQPKPAAPPAMPDFEEF